MNKQEALQIAGWARTESAKLEKKGERAGYPIDKNLLIYWTEHRPKMVKALGTAAAALAHVLTSRMLDAERENLQAGLPWTDAREQAEKDWLLQEPEDEAPIDPLLRLTAGPTTDSYAFLEEAEQRAYRSVQETKHLPLREALKRAFRNE